jgi:transcriptional regulator with XRE-family HTH domain
VPINPPPRVPWPRGDWRQDLLRRIRLAWCASGLSQAQLAEGIDRDEVIAAAILDGTRPPTVEELMRLPTVLHVSGDWLLTGALPIDRPGVAADVERAVRIAEAELADRVIEATRRPVPKPGAGSSPPA